MQTSRSVRRRFWLRSLGGLAASALVSLGTASGLPAGDNPSPGPIQPAVGLVGITKDETGKGEAAVKTGPAASDLPSLRRWALDKQPVLAASRASLVAAQLKAKALDDLMVPTLLRKDLPIRRQQAARGVNIAEAQLCQAEWQTVYNVTRNYLSALYALEQQQVADDALQDLNSLKTFVKTHQGDRSDLVPEHLDRLEVYIRLAQARREEAVTGYQRAVAAVREAVGVGPDCCLDLAHQPLPDLNASICRDEVIKLALARRGDLAQAILAAEIVCLEIDAQEAQHGPSGQTFAAGSDIHVIVPPQGSNDPNYKPGGLALEMPTLLPGSKSNRVDQARALSARAAAVADKTRNLIALEAEDVWLRWQEASNKKQKLIEARDKAAAYSKAIREDFEATMPDGDKKFKVRFDDVLNAGLLAAQAKVEYNQAHYQADLGLAGLERVTAGGFNSGMDPQLCNPGGH
jgi:outer membrane protein TolC